MKTSNTASALDRWMHFLGAMLIAALMVPAAIAAGPTTVNLGTSGDFVILSKTGITTTGATSITGDIGVSPINATAITGFGLIADASNTFSRSSLVTGKIYAANYTSPTPTKLTTAVSDMQTAYTDAAGRTIPDHTELYAGDVTGKTLTSGLYKWGTGVLISAGGVTLSGSASDVWIFQIAQDLTVANGAIVTLGGGALASNIFWQVAGKVTIGTTAAMKGIILCQTQIAMQTGATLNGRALAQTAVTLIANTVTQPATVVITLPTITSADPVNTATSVALNKQITATFSKTMDGSTITASTFTLIHGTTSISGIVSYSGTTATFAPASNLAPSTLYTATITTGVKDIAGNALANNYVWSFTTAAIVTPLTVSSPVPANAAIDVALNQKIAATFSKTMNASTITASTFTLMQGTTSVSGIVSFTGTTAAFAPASNFAPNTLYTATITTGAKDLTGNALASNYVWSFTTGAAVVVTPPIVSSTELANAAIDVALNHEITATFSVAMDASTITESTFTLMQGATSVSGIVSCSGTTATFAPASNFAPNTLYTATITTGAKDLAGNALANDYVWRFTTGAAVTAVGSGLAPHEFALLQNYPNPFNPSTRIQYNLEKAGMVSLKVYNVLGLEVATLVNAYQQANSYTVQFNTHEGGLNLSSGVYFYRLEAGSFVSTKRLILIK
jgi:hypothetical protein